MIEPPHHHPASAANRIRATESPFTENANDFCNKIGIRAKSPAKASPRLASPCDVEGERDDARRHSEALQVERSSPIAGARAGPAMAE